MNPTVCQTCGTLANSNAHYFGEGQGRSAHEFVPAPVSTSTLSDAELCHDIAEAIGLHPDVVRAHGRPLRLGDYPNYARSIDALSEPEQRLRGAGWWLEATTHPRWASAMWVPPAPAYYMPRVVAPTEARARAEACLDALKALGEARS